MRYKHFLYFFICICFFNGITNLPVYCDEVMTPEKIIRMRSIFDPQISPGGKRVAYVLATLDTKENKYTKDIYTVNIETQESIRMTYHPKNDLTPRWSPEGRRIAFLSNRSGKYQIWLISVFGGEAHVLTELEKDGVSGGIWWAPDGKKIAFLVPRELTEEEKKAKKEKKDAVVFEETFRMNQLAVMDLDTRKTVRLTNGKTLVSDVAWSPDSEKIVFTSRPSPDIDDLFSSKIYLIDSSGGPSKRLTTTDDLREMNPAWSPDGKFIAFNGQAGYDFWSDPGDVYVVPSSGGDAKNLTSKLDRDERVKAWTVDSRGIIFRFESGAYAKLGRVDFKNKKIDLLSNKKLVFGDLSLRPGLKHMAMMITDPMNPPDLWTSDLEMNNFNRLIRSNPDIDDIKLGETRIVRWKSFDGKAIEGILVLPVNYEDRKTVPLIVVVHGGPQGARGMSFNPIWQMFSGAGYAVFAPNFRGSSNYGRDFVRANIGDWGGGDYKDIMSGVDYLIEKGIVDKNRLGIQGWSYGGFMTNWVITHTNRFKAAVSGAGFSNLESFYGTTDIQGYMEYYHKGAPWESRDIYRRSSPLTSSLPVHTPTLILHGEEDHRVPISQSEELYQFLKKKGVEVKFVRYPREGHILREPCHRLDWYTRMLNWFNKCLKKD